MVDTQGSPLAYHPNSILLPNHYKESKDLYELFLPGAGIAPPGGYPRSLMEQRFTKGVVVAEEDIARWQQTPTPLFYDVFAVAGRPLILAFGRDLARLRKILGELKIYSGGKQIAYAHSSEDGSKIAEPLLWLVIELAAPVEKPMELSFHWPSFSQTVTVGPNPWQSQASIETLITLQKDNAVEWIRDWCLYYHRLHNINRILIYNNKGMIEPELQQMAASLDQGLQVHFVVWPFLWDWDSCSQRVAALSCCVGMLNHSYWWLADRAKLFLNFDVDEYLVNDSGKALADFLSSRAKKENRGVYVTGYNVPSIDLGGKLLRLRDFRFRGRKLVGHFRKMFYAPLCWGHISNHLLQRSGGVSHPVRKVLANDLLANKRGFSFVKSKMLYYADYWSWWWWEFSVKSHLRALSLRAIKGLSAMSRKMGLASSLFGFIQGQSQEAGWRAANTSAGGTARGSPSAGNTPELCFLHYRGLNTRWNALRLHDTAPIAPASDTKHVQDPSMQIRLKQIRLDK